MNKYTFMGNGRNKDFYFTFPFFSINDIVVEINGNTATGYGVFCIPRNNDKDFPFTGGRIHFTRAPKSTDVVTIERKLQLNRLIDYQTTATLNSTVINQDMNYFFELLKDIKNDLNCFAQTYSDFTNTETAQTLLERINSVTNEIENMGDISTIRSNITNLGTAVSQLTGSMDTLSNTVGAHSSNISTLNSFKEGVIDYIVASQTPSSSNGYTWYRKYNTGWIEQGGSISSASTGNYTVTFPVAMNDTNYTILKTMNTSSSSNGLTYYQVSFFNKTTTKATTNTAGVGFSWVVYGIAAQ